MLDTMFDAGNTWIQNIEAHTRATAIMVGIILKESVEYANLNHYLAVQMNHSSSGT